MKKIIDDGLTCLGLLLLFSPVIGTFVVVVFQNGWQVALNAFLVIVGVLAVMTIGTILVFGR